MQELDRLERTRAEPKAAYGIFDLSQQRSALIQQRVDAVKRLAETVNRADALRTRLAYLTETRPKLPSQIASSQTETNLVAVHARQALVDLREKEAVMAVTYDPHHPLLMRLRQQIDMVQKELSTMQDTSTRISLSPSPIASSVDQEIVTSRAELAPLQDQASRDKELVGSITDELRHIEQADMQLRILDSRIVDQNENLKMMRQLYDKARTEDEMDQAKVTSVVQTAHATTPDKPVAPNKFLLAVGGALAGLISACGVVILATITNRNFLSEGALERFLGLPVLGSIPLQAPERRRLV